MRAIICAAALLAAGPTLAQTAAPDAAPIVAAERAFAADAPVMGLTASFNKWAVPDAVMIAGGQVQTVRDVFPPDVPRPADEIRLEWWPNFAGISRSGDLGFTTGGVAVNGQRTGHYFTVWKEQPDGSWRWVYDGGSGATAADVPGPDSEPVILGFGAELLRETYNERPISNTPFSERAMAAVKAREAALAVAAATDQKAAHLAVMAANGRLYVAPRPPAIGPEAFAEALSDWPETFQFGPTEGGGAARYGDLVWTYGPAAWTSDGQSRTGHYVRVWQRQFEGWRIVLAQLIPAPIAPPSPAGD
ncbi:MAG: hypothetical protein Q8O54_01345 [Brevundimonas sp.]|nr:hypothetical protein [Brevundimonas sp.]